MRLMTQKSTHNEMRFVEVALLKEKVAKPNASTRELSKVLKEKYDISLSHTRISEILREMKERKVFRESIIPNENMFTFFLLEISFNNEHFKDEWRGTLEYILNDPHTLLFFITDGVYRWKMIMIFRTFEEMSKWSHNLLKEHGKLIDELNINVLYRVLKFDLDEKVFDDYINDFKEKDRS